MKRLLPLSLLLIGCPTPPVTPPTPPPTLTWTSNGNPTIPLCGGSVTKNCLTTFSILQDGTLLASQIPGSALAYTLSQLPPSGLHTYELIINGVAADGTAVVSPPATTTVMIP